MVQRHAHGASQLFSLQIVLRRGVERGQRVEHGAYFRLVLRKLALLLLPEPGDFEPAEAAHPGEERRLAAPRAEPGNDLLECGLDHVERDVAVARDAAIGEAI